MNPAKAQQGSVLITTLIFAALVAIALTSFFRLATSAPRMADRSFYANGAQNLADTGLEQALWSMNNSNGWSTGGFTARGSGFTNQYQATFPSSSTYFTLAQGVKGQVKVWVDAGTVPSTPKVVAKATITLGDGTTIDKFAEIWAQKRSYFTNGMVAKELLDFNGNNVTVDSWNSHSDTASTADDVPYSSGVAHDGGKIASLRVTAGSISVGQADVYGYAAVGGNAVNDISVGNNGRVGPYGTGGGVIDQSRVTYDFTTSFPDVSAPSAPSVNVLGAINSSVTLPNAGDSSVTVTDSVTGVTTTTYYYTVPSISLGGNSDVLSISPGKNVVITVTNTTGSSVSINGNNAGIALLNTPATSSTVLRPSTLALYVAADVAITGNGISNGTLVSGQPSSPPIDFQLYGTRSGADAATSGMQSIAVKGNGFFDGIVYAPNGDVRVNGNGDLYGSVVANTVTMTGNGNFHFDESLGNIASSNLYGVIKWRELALQSERTTYTTELSF